MKKNMLWCLTTLILSLTLISCSKVVDPVTTEDAHSNLRSLLIDIFKNGPQDPWGPQGEFETTDQYETRLEQQKNVYLVEAEKYYDQIQKNTYYIVHKVEDLPRFDADTGMYNISFSLATTSSNPTSDSAGPDFRLFVPPQVVENIHLFDEYGQSFEEGWVIAESGGLGNLTFSAVMDAAGAEQLRYAATSLDIFLRIGVQFEFPQHYQGYRFLPDRYAPFDDGEMFDSPRVVQMKEEDLTYAATNGMVVVKVASVEIVDEDGLVYHKWPEGLIPARTPTPSGEDLSTPPATPTPDVTPVVTPTEISFCPDAMPTRMRVGIGGRVTYGDPRKVRVRVAPSSSAAVFRLLQLGKEFQVIGGPECADGFVWWEIEFDNYSGFWVGEGENENYHIEPIE